MNARIKRLRQEIIAKKHQEHLRDLAVDLAADYSRRGLSADERMVERLVYLLEAEEPLLGADERLAFTRTIRTQPPLFTTDEWAEIGRTRYLHELGLVSNVTPDYYTTIAAGFRQRRREIAAALPGADEAGRRFLGGLLRVMDAVGDLAARYRQCALDQGNTAVADVLARIPEAGATTFHEALQFFRILHFTLWLEGEYHNTIGRFDLHVMPWLQRDLDSGRLDETAARDLLLEFFLSFNKDSNLYPGVQQGDNGQSMVLGGCDRAGRPVFNRLTELCLETSQTLKLIDPKINLRVNRDTPRSVYRLGTELTRAGLGFPQYSNDDVVIPGLIALGYEPADAADYSIAACWEFIIPGRGLDVANIAAVNFPELVDRAVRAHLEQARSFADFWAALTHLLRRETAALVAGCAGLWFVPAPFLSLLSEGAVERRQDISLGARYNNWGLHGTGIATAVDALVNISKLVFEEQALQPLALIAALDDDFADTPYLLHRLRYESPKFGDGTPEPEEMAVRLLDAFADAVADLRNERGGRIRPGTGTAMYYLWHAQSLGATADGRRRGEPFAANYTPSLFARLPGPVSIIRSLTRPDLSKVINGGPLTLEFHDTVFRTAENLDKVAALVQWFIELGGHQLQLNAVNRETLLDAQRDPAAHPQLIVRVWGWSAYFCELDAAYQEHVLRRAEYDTVG